MAVRGKRAFPKDDRKSIAGSAHSAELGNQRESTDVRGFWNNHDNKKKKQQTNPDKVQSTLFFFFSSLNRLACAQGVPRKQPGGVPSRTAVGSGFPLPLGAAGTAGVSGLGPLLLRRRGIVLVHGENYFLEAVGGEEAALAPIKVGCPSTSIHTPDLTIYTVYTHTHSPAGRQSVPLVRFESQGSIMGITPAPQPLQKD